MNLDSIVKLFEFLIVSAILYKYYKLYLQNIKIRNSELFWFIQIVWFNIIFYNLNPNSTFFKNFIDTVIPVFIFIYILLESKSNTQKMIFALITICIIKSLKFNFLPISFFYLASILVLILKSLKLNKLSSAKLQISTVYLVIAIDQILSFIAFVLSSIKFNWRISNYLEYFKFTSYFVFTFTYLVIYVKFRRLNSI